MSDLEQLTVTDAAIAAISPVIIAFLIDCNCADKVRRKNGIVSHQAFYNYKKLLLLYMSNKLVTCILLCIVTAAACERGVIKKVENVVVYTPVGTVPRLPWQVQVQCSKGRVEFRQVRWENSAREVEEDEANPAIHPAGSSYTINGWIIGDTSSDNGYPVMAEVHISDADWAVPASDPVAEPLPLADVQLTGKNRLTSNRDIDTDNLLRLDVKQQLYNYYDSFGLPTSGYPVSDGWDSPTTKLKGHGSGHYMSAIAFAYAGCTDPDKKAGLKDRAKTMVDELRKCQERTFVWEQSLGRYREARDLAPGPELEKLKGNWDAFDEYKKDWEHYGYGYLNAIPAQHPVLIEMYRPYDNDNWVWAPYYSIHKQLAGLIDIALNIDDKDISGKALLIAKDMGLWVWNRLHYRTYMDSSGTMEERRARPGNRYEMWNMYIAGEVGGMQESLSRLSEMVSDPEEKSRLAEAALYFAAPAFFDPLAKNIDDIRTRHANQHIPMITGALRSFRTNGDPYFYNLAVNFWHLIQGRYAYAMGGVGNGEMFRQPYSQIESMNSNPGPELNETCCAYNLAKLTKDLNCYDPDDARYMDYYEQLLYNQIVGSVHPEHFLTTYHYAVGMNARKPFGNDSPQSTCCGGTGSENHVKYQEAAYFVSGDTIWIALYLPTIARWKAKGIVLEQECGWPAEKSTIRITEGSGQFTVKLRIPYWATDGIRISCNGKTMTTTARPSSYFTVSRNWKEGDELTIEIPFAAHINYGPDKMTLDKMNPDKAIQDRISQTTAEDGETECKSEGETGEKFEADWVGTIMYGPMAMATSDIENWSEAEVRLSGDLHEIQKMGVTGDDGTSGGLYTVILDGKTFHPDYWHTGYSTHYLRIKEASRYPVRKQ